MSEPTTTELNTCGCCESGVEEPKHENRPGQPALNYRIGTHSSFLRRMLASLARQEIPSGEHAGDRPLARLTTRATDDASIAMLDAWATAADVLTFYQERIANEGFLRTATERRSVLELARAIGYELNPGVAASTYLAFTVDESDSTPDTATIKAGTQVQSIPAKEGELPQTFETSEEFEARVEWNALTPKQTDHHAIKAGIKKLYLQGVNLQLEPGDAILIVGPEREKDSGNENWDVRILKTVDDFPEDDYTLVTWEEPLGLIKGGTALVHPAADATAKVYVFHQRLALFGHNAPDWRVMSKDVREMYCGKGNTACIDGSEWPNFDLNTKSLQLHIDGDHPEIVAPTWIALTDDNYTELYRVTEAVASSQTNFALSGKTTRVTLKSPENLNKFGRRTAVVLAEPEELTRAEKPLTTNVKGNTIVLSQAVSGLKKGQPLIISGKLNEDDEDPVSEVAFFEPSAEKESYTTLRLKESLDNEYVRSTVTIFANVVAATHGETVPDEVLGSGNGAQANQRFTLKQSPLTYVSASTTSGAESTLALRVNDVLWQNVSSLYGKGKGDKTYIVRIDDDAKATVIFGDGKSGARLPTGQENIKATYRFGIGSDGEVGANTLSLLKKRPFGVRSVTNPVAASGAADPEKLENARTNAPLTVLTLDRIVSLRDFEDFARAFAGIGKAQAVSIWNGESHLVHITLADDDGDPVSDDTMEKLRDAIDDARDPSVDVVLDNYDPLTFALEVTVQYDGTYLEEKVQAGIGDALKDAFSFEKRSFGQPVTAAEIFATIHQVEGVIAVDLNALYAKTTAGKPVVALLPQKLTSAIGSFLGIGGIGSPKFTLPGVLAPVASKETAPAAVLPAQTARREKGKLLPAQLLLLDDAGIHLTMKALKVKAG